MTTKRKKRRRAGISLLLSLPLLLASVCCAQIQAPVTPQNGAPAARSIVGTVTDAKKVPVTGAVVLLKDTKTLQVRSYLAGKDGIYRFLGLSSDVNYELRAQRGDMTSKAKTVSVFNSHKVVTLNLKLDKKKKF